MNERYKCKYKWGIQMGNTNENTNGECKCKYQIIYKKITRNLFDLFGFNLLVKFNEYTLQMLISSNLELLSLNI